MIVMVVVAALAGPINFTLGTLVLMFGFQALPWLGEAGAVGLSLLISCGVTLALCVIAITRLTSLPAAWGYVLGVLLALVTNPIVLTAVLGGT